MIQCISCNQYDLKCIVWWVWSNVYRVIRLHINFKSLKCSLKILSSQLKKIKWKRFSFQESSFFENPEPKPRVEVGKLNPESIFKPSPSEERFEIKVGKIDTSNLFRPVDPEEPIGQPLISVGKLNPARNPFREPSPEEKPRVKVGKIKPKQFLPDSPIDDKPELVVGKLNPENIFPLSPSQSEEVKFYKPTVQPKKMKVEQVFPLLMQEEPRIQVKISVFKINRFSLHL